MQAIEIEPVETDPLARLCVLFDGRGRMWVDQVSLMPADAAQDFRAVFGGADCPGT